MASLLLRPLLRPQLFAAAPFGLGLSLYTYHHLTSRSRAYKLDGFGAASLGGGGGATGTYSYSKDARTPVVTKSDGGKWKLNPRAVRQVSFGSITGGSRSSARNIRCSITNANFVTSRTLCGFTGQHVFEIASSASWFDGGGRTGTVPSYAEICSQRV